MSNAMLDECYTLGVPPAAVAARLRRLDRLQPADRWTTASTAAVWCHSPPFGTIHREGEVNATAGRGLAAIGAVLAIVGIFLTRFFSTSYWDIDGTFAWFGLILGALALALTAAAYAGNPMDGWIFGIGALLVGYWGFFPAALAFDQWDDTGVGLWMTFAGAILIAVGVALPALAFRDGSLDTGGHLDADARRRPRHRPASPVDLARRERRRELLGRPERAFPRDRAPGAHDRRRLAPGRGASPAHRRRAPTWRSRSSCSGSSPSPRSGPPSTTSARSTSAPGSGSRAGDPRRRWDLGGPRRGDAAHGRCARRAGWTLGRPAGSAPRGRARRPCSPRSG